MPSQEADQMQAALNGAIHSVTVDIFIVLGMLWVFLQVLGFLRMTWRQCIRGCCQSKKRLYNTYGDKNSMNGTWAVVTGGSDGIGLGFCKKLARDGFNICIVSRNESKINEKLEEIKNECRPGDASFQTKCVVADFWKMKTIQEYREQVGEPLAGMDIGILALNAGFSQMGKLVDLKDEEVERQMQINANHVIYLAKVMLPQLDKRYEEKKVKSCMVVTSSLLREMPLAGVITYAATKIFASYMSIGLHYEHEGKVDIMSYEPAGVATKMIGTDQVDCGTISALKAAETCFRDVGCEVTSPGALAHEISGSMWRAAPAASYSRAFVQGLEKTNRPVEIQREYNEAAAAGKATQDWSVKHKDELKFE